jgi:hypothetical protein
MCAWARGGGGGSGQVAWVTVGMPVDPVPGSGRVQHLMVITHMTSAFGFSPVQSITCSQTHSSADHYDRAAPHAGWRPLMFESWFMYQLWQARQPRGRWYARPSKLSELVDHCV